MSEAENQTTVKNTVTIEDIGPCKKKVSVEVPEETIKKQTDEQYETLRKEAVVPGFRKGRAPRRLLEKRFGKDTGEQVKLKLLAETSEAAIKDNNLKVLGEPQIDIEKISLPESGTLKFDFEVEVQPEFELPALEGIEVKKNKREVTEQQVDEEIIQFRKWSGLWTPKEGGKVESGDQVIADTVIKVEGEEKEQKLENVEVFVRKNGLVGEIPVPELDELLVGAETGEVKQKSLEVPKTYYKEEYRGKKVELALTIKDIKWLKPAELDANFFERIGVSSEKELRENSRTILVGRLERQIRAEMTDEVYKYLRANTNFDLPTEVVADQSERVLRRSYVNLLMRGFSREQVEEKMEELRTSSEQQAKEQLKVFFIMSKVAEKLGVKVTDEEVNGHIAQLAIQRGMRPERLKEDMSRDGSLAELGVQIRDDKCIAKLLESAKIIEVEEPAAKAETKADKHEEKKSGKAERKSAREAEVTERKKAKKRKTSPKKQSEQ